MEMEGKYIVAVPLDNNQNKIFLKDLEVTDKGITVKYKTTINDLPWQKVDLIESPSDNCFTIHGGNGVVLYRIAAYFIQKLYYQGVTVETDEQQSN